MEPLDCRGCAHRARCDPSPAATGAEEAPSAALLRPTLVFLLPVLAAIAGAALAPDGSAPHWQALAALSGLGAGAAVARAAVERPAGRDDGAGGRR